MQHFPVVKYNRKHPKTSKCSSCNKKNRTVTNTCIQNTNSASINIHTAEIKANNLLDKAGSSSSRPSVSLYYAFNDNLHCTVTKGRQKHTNKCKINN